QRADVGRIDLRGEGDGGRGAGEGQSGQFLHDLLVELLVAGDAFGFIGVAADLAHLVEQVLVVHAPRVVVGGEPGADEVVGVVVVTGPAEQVQGAVPALGLGGVLGPLVGG